MLNQQPIIITLNPGENKAGELTSWRAKTREEQEQLLLQHIANIYGQVKKQHPENPIVIVGWESLLTDKDHENKYESQDKKALIAKIADAVKGKDLTVIASVRSIREMPVKEFLEGRETKASSIQNPRAEKIRKAYVAHPKITDIDFIKQKENFASICAEIMQNPKNTDPVKNTVHIYRNSSYVVTGKQNSAEVEISKQDKTVPFLNGEYDAPAINSSYTVFQPAKETRVTTCAKKTVAQQICADIRARIATENLQNNHPKIYPDFAFTTSDTLGISATWPAKVCFGENNIFVDSRETNRLIINDLLPTQNLKQTIVYQASFEPALTLDLKTPIQYEKFSEALLKHLETLGHIPLQITALELAILPESVRKFILNAHEVGAYQLLYDIFTSCTYDELSALEHTPLFNLLETNETAQQQFLSILPHLDETIYDTSDEFFDLTKLDKSFLLQFLESVSKNLSDIRSVAHQTRLRLCAAWFEYNFQQIHNHPSTDLPQIVQNFIGNVRYEGRHDLLYKIFRTIAYDQIVELQNSDLFKRYDADSSFKQEFLSICHLLDNNSFQHLAHQEDKVLTLFLQFKAENLSAITTIMQIENITFSAAFIKAIEYLRQYITKNSSKIENSQKTTDETFEKSAPPLALQEIQAKNQISIQASQQMGFFSNSAVQNVAEANSMSTKPNVFTGE